MTAPLKTQVIVLVLLHLLMVGKDLVGVPSTVRWRVGISISDVKNRRCAALPEAVGRNDHGVLEPLLWCIPYALQYTNQYELVVCWRQLRGKGASTEIVTLSSHTIVAE